MTRLYIDAREVPCTVPDLSTLADLLRHVEQNYLPPDCVVRQINLDGTPLRVSEIEQDYIQLRDSVEIFTGTVSDAAAESAEEAVSFLERAESGVPQLAVDLKESPGPAVHESLRQLYEGFFWLSLLLDRLRATLRLDLDQLLVCGASAATHQRRLAEVLRQLIDAQKSEDFDAISLLLESEILAMVPIWKKMLVEITARARPPH